MVDFYADIHDFHKKFGLEYTGNPRALPLDMGEFRVNFMHEELKEYTTAQLKAWSVAHVDRDSNMDQYTQQLENALDGLVDLVYVVLGTAYLHGFDFNEAWIRVHQANMRKVRATDAGQSKRGSQLDVVKPKGWMPPTHTDLVDVHDLFEGD